MLALGELLQKRVLNSIKLKEAQEKAKEILLAGDFDTYLEFEAETREFFVAEERLSAEINTVYDLSNIDADDGLNEKVKVLKKMLLGASKLVEENTGILEKMVEENIKEQKKNNSVGNIASKYRTHQTTIPKFLDIEK